MKTICVFCSSNLGTDPTYQQVATEMGAELASNGFNVVYGGANVGLMRCMAEAAIAGGSEVTGVITHFLAGKHLTQPGLKKLISVETMHERKAKMNELSDGFIVMPGGFGTMEEMFEILTEGQLGFHNKPVVVLNANNFYQHLKSQFEFMISQKMLLEPHAHIVQFADTPQDVIVKLLQYKPQSAGNWIDDIHRDNGHIANLNFNELLNNLELVHTTELGVARIRRNLSLGTGDVVEWCKSRISSANAVITKNGKNWYVSIDGCVITINAYSYTIITAHKAKGQF